MTHDQNPQFDAHAQEDEAIFFLRMTDIRDDAGVLVEEGRSRLLE